MSIEDLIYNRYSSYNKRDIDGFMNTMTEDVQAHFLKYDYHIEGAKPLREQFEKVFAEDDPKIKLGVRQILVEKDQVVVVEQVIDSSDQEKIDKRSIVVKNIRDGKISEFWVH